MSTIAFRVDENLKRELEHLAKRNGISLSALIKMYITKAKNRDLNELTENGMTVSEELELLVMDSEKFDGKTYGLDEYIKHIKSLDD